MFTKGTQDNVPILRTIGSTMRRILSVRRGNIRLTLIAMVRRTPILGRVVAAAYRAVIKKSQPFSNSSQYWEQRYKSGGDSGAGSYNELAAFKAATLNRLVEEFGIKTVIEFGCGDGSQLTRATYPSYLGLDVSQHAILKCKQLFQDDRTKAFASMVDYVGQVADLALSLDVVYHLVEDDIFVSYMDTLFGSARRFVVIYSSNTDSQLDSPGLEHVRHREFSKWVEVNQPEWQLHRQIPNMYPWDSQSGQGSFADFFIYMRSAGPSESTNP